MKKMIMLFILCFSFSFADTVWLAAGTSASVDLGSGYYGGDVDLDDGGLEIGYTRMLKQDGKMGWGLGGTYHLAAMGEDGFEAKFLTLYGLGTHSLSNEMGVWFGLGLGLPQGDIDEGDAGLAYSFGVMYNLNEKMILGLGYTVNSTSISESGYSQDFDFSRMTFNFGYRM
ncbi:MAG: hypothetical protein CMG49_01260 [Candidatus Marinimicrobia bacterium]|nr:hypothetical protein [Candidatus Neomarinimicrobiota bacterium]|tara:strand:- start:72 stop:584 length:513 start_codon:yes stop_codon:yes gene_type:complete